MSDFTESNDLAALILEDQRKTRASGAGSFLEDFAGLGPVQDQKPATAGPPAEPDPEFVGPPVAPPKEPVGPRIARDVGRGITEAPKQIVGGALDALYSLGSLLNPEMQSGVLGSEFDAETGEFRVVQEKTAEEAQADARAKFEATLRPADATTVTGGLVRGVSQFLTGFAVGAKGLGAAGGMATKARVARAAGASIFSDFAAFDGHEERLSDLIETYPALSNPITQYLQSDEDDSELEGRLKNVAEGVLSDVAVTGLVAALRGMRQARKARAAVGGETYADAARRLAMDPEIGRDVVPQIRAARTSDLPLVSKAVDDAGPETAANALIGSKVSMPDGDVFINWSRIDTAEDVKSVIQQMADAGKGEIDQARRGVRSNAETALSAEKENAWKLLADRRQGAAMNAEETLAMRQLWSASAERLTDAARAVQAAPTPENVFMFRRAVALHGTIQREVIAVRTETARALQQWSIPAGSNDVVARQIGEAVDAFGGADVADDLAAKIIGLSERGEYGAIDELSRRSVGAATVDAVHEYWINALLSGPKTHLVNSISNASVIALAQIERLAAAGIGAIRGGADRISAREAGAMLYSSIAALPDAWRYAKRAFMTGESGFGGLHRIEAPRRRAISTEALANTRSPAFNKVMNQPLIAHGINSFGVVANVPTRALGAEDEFFKTINYRMELHAQAVRQAMDDLGPDAAPEALKTRIAEIVDNPPDSVAVRAREFAQYNTFTNDAGKIARVFRDFRERVPFMKFVVPFLNTPANIFRFAIERSPAAPILPGVLADIRAGGRRADLALARMGLGSATMLTAFGMAMNGQISGSGPASYNERQALERAGWQRNSVKIGDRWFAYNRLDPLGLQLAIAANMAELARNGDIDVSEDYDEAVYGAIGSVGQSMMDKTYVAGLADLFNAMSDPDRYADSYFQRLAGSFVPAFVREAEGFIDPELRRASDTLETIRSKIPGMSEDLPVRHDLWGRPISYASGLGAGYDAVSPIYSRKEDAEPIDLELQRIGYFPALPSKSLTIDRERFNLKNQPAIYEEYVVLQGATSASVFPVDLTARGEPTAAAKRLQSFGDMTLMQALNAVVTGAHAMSADYADADEPGRERIVKQIISDFRDAARAKLIADHPDVFTPGKGQK